MDFENPIIPKISVRQHWSLIRYILGLIFKKHARYSIVFSVTLLLTALTPALTIWIAKLILDQLALLIQSTGSIKVLLQLVVLEVALIIAKSLLQKSMQLMTSRFTELFQLDLKAILLTNNDTLRYQHFEDPQFYNKYDISSKQVINSASGYLSLMVNFFRAIIQVVSISAILVIVDVWFLFAIILINVINFYISRNVSKRQYKIIGKTTESRRFIAYLYDLMTDIKTIRDLRLYHMGASIYAKFKDQTMKNMEVNLNIEKKEVKIFMAFDFFTTCVYYGFYIYIVVQVAHRALSLGDIALFQRSYSTLDGSLSAISSSYLNIYENNLYLQIFYDLVFNPSFKLNDELMTKIDAIDNIQCQNLGFSYPGSTKKIISQCSIAINSGDLVAVVGKNGTGKSTLAKLMSGIYQPSSGVVTVNGVDLEALNKESYQKRVSVMLQDYNQYEFSIKENITCLDPSVNESRLQWALSYAQLNDFVMTLPNGLNTVLSRRFHQGTNVSAGQWQRIALARALYKDADVLILDEPTSYLDVAFSQHFFSSLMELKSHYTAIVIITHKLHFIQYFNKILYFDERSMVTEGLHEDLLNDNESYSYLLSD